MRILVTGAAGFVGSHLIPQLITRGHHIIGVDLQAECQSNVAIHADLRSVDKIPKFDLCIHLASSVGGFLHNAENQSIIIYEQELLTKVKQLCDTQHTSRIIYTSSINVFEKYPKITRGPLEIFNQQSPYAIAKSQGEVFVQQNFNHYAIIRPTNLFGKSQTSKNGSMGSSHVIPELLKKIEQNDIVEVFGDGTQVRNFIHISDACRFIASILETPKYYNLRSDIQLSITQLVHELLKLKKINKPLVYRPEYMRYEPNPVTLFEQDWECNIKSIAEGLI